MYQVIVPVKFMTMAQVKRIDLEDKKGVLLRKDFSHGIFSICMALNIYLNVGTFYY